MEKSVRRAPQDRGWERACWCPECPGGRRGGVRGHQPGKPGEKGRSISRGRHLASPPSGIADVGMRGAQMVGDEQDTSNTPLPQVSPSQAGPALTVTLRC